MTLTTALGSYAVRASASQGAMNDPATSSEFRTSAQPVASYRLTAELDASSHRIRGHGRLTWTNDSALEARELWFHLYLNAFENEETLFLRDGTTRSGVALRDAGHITVHSLLSPEFPGVDLWDAAAGHSPGDPEDRTDIRVALPAPIPPGKTVDFDVEFTSQLPQLVERTGYFEGFHLVAHWFPKLARREPDGTWVHFPFHPFAEFYADFGDYEVILDVPEDHVVGSTGQHKALPAHAGRKRVRATASGVHDFAWTSWPKFDSSSRVIASTQARLMTPPGVPLVERITWNTLDFALKHMEDAYGPYPHPTLTVVHPPPRAAPADGMEYPSFITTGGSAWASFVGVRVVEILTVHELAHQWFQGMVASNEVEAPFLDEGLTSYAEWRCLEEQYGPSSLAHLGPLTVSRSAAGRLVALGRGESKGEREAIAQPAAAFDSFTSLAKHVYSKTALSLDTLARVYGPEALHEALSVYAHRYRFAHPTVQDFLATLEEELGPEAGEAASAMFLEPSRIDVAVDEVEPLADGRWLIALQRQGNIELPYDVEVTTRSGALYYFTCVASRRRCERSMTLDSPPATVLADPQARIRLDEDLSNNRRDLDEAPSKAGFQITLGTAWQFLLQVLAP